MSHFCGVPFECFVPCLRLCLERAPRRCWALIACHVRLAHLGDESKSLAFRNWLGLRISFQVLWLRTDDGDIFVIEPVLGIGIGDHLVMWAVDAVAIQCVRHVAFPPLIQQYHKKHYMSNWLINNDHIKSILCISPLTKTYDRVYNSDARLGAWRGNVDR